MQAQVEAHTKELATKVAQVKKEKTVSTQAPKSIEAVPQCSTSVLGCSFALQDQCATYLSWLSCL